MTAPSVDALLTDALPGRHLAQLHRDAAALAQSVAPFLEAGLERGQNVVVIASQPHIDLLLARLTKPAVGHLELVDAEELLERLTVNRMPAWEVFRAALTTIFERMPAGRSIRIYGEIASMLWEDGNTDAAIRLEELWNQLGRLTPFVLYCGYYFDTQSEKSYSGPLEDLGHAHTDILGTPDDERFGRALDRASKELFGISLSQMAGLTNQDGARRFPSGQRTMLWVKRNLPSSTARLAERARQYFQDQRP